jgi:hypothetical protein
MQVFTLNRASCTVLIAFLCCGVALQILGVQISFWQLDGSSDLVECTLLEGFGIIAAGPEFAPLVSYTLSSDVYDPTRRLPSLPLLFRPPLIVI